jgi:hypothetical protein
MRNFCRRPVFDFFNRIDSKQTHGVSFGHLIGSAADSHRMFAFGNFLLFICYVSLKYLDRINPNKIGGSLAIFTRRE